MKKKKKKRPIYKNEKSRKRALRKRSNFPYQNKINKGTSSYSKKNDLNWEKDSLYAPTIFSIQQNTDETLEFFTRMDKKLRKKPKIILRMDNVVKLTEDAILYLLSRVYYNKEKKFTNILGTFPKNNECKELLLKSKFTEYVKTDVKSIANSEIFPIERGNKVDGKIVEGVLKFIDEKIILLPENKARIYNPLMEGLTNVKNHAYKKEKKWNLWWLIAVPDKNNDCIHLTILDNGLGIPTTIKKRIFERVLKTDVELLISALYGQYRSRTGQEERGTGLPSLFEITDLDQVKSLTIISNNAYIEVENSFGKV